MDDPEPTDTAGPADDEGQPTPSDPDVRPLSVTAAGLILAILGVFTALIGAVLLVVVMLNADPAALPDYIDAVPVGFVGVAGVIGALMAAYGMAGIVVGVLAMRRHAAGRRFGVVLAAAGVILLVAAMIQPGQATGATPVIFVPLIGALAYAAVALASEGRWFEEAG